MIYEVEYTISNNERIEKAIQDIYEELNKASKDIDDLYKKQHDLAEAVEHGLVTLGRAVDDINKKAEEKAKATVKAEEKKKDDDIAERIADVAAINDILDFTNSKMKVKPVDWDVKDWDYLLTSLYEKDYTKAVQAIKNKCNRHQ